MIAEQVERDSKQGRGHPAHLNRNPNRPTLPCCIPQIFRYSFPMTILTPSRIAKTILAFLLAAAVTAAHAATGCPPTPPDEIGPFYRPNAPMRSKIGSGYVLSGTVRSSADCKPIPGARIEVWQVGPAGKYDDAHRATLVADQRGRYRLETDFPPPYLRRPSHIHILVDARGFAGLITQHYPRAGKKKAYLDLVLEPE